MKTFRYISLMKHLLLIAIAVSPRSGSAAPILPDEPSMPDKSAVAYYLTSSLGTSANALPSYDPTIMLRLTNMTHDTLVYSWVPGLDTNYASFHVEYKTPKDNPDRKIGWIPLKPNTKLEPKSTPSNSDPVVSMISNRQRICVLPGGNAGQAFLPNFSMTKPGFYRIVAVMTIPHASEFNGEVSAATLVKNFTLVAFSKPLVIRRTATGFAEVPAVTSKPMPVH